jgi:membrane glycosyltransferase
MGMLLIPKVYGLCALALQPRPVAEYGGWARILGSGLFEILLSVLVSPLMALYHARFVLGILFGRKVDWDPQQREDCGVSFSAAFREHWRQTVFGLLLAGGLLAFAPSLFLWFAPIYLGLIGSIPLVMLLGSPLLGRRLADWGLLLTPDETNPAPVLRRAKQLQEAFQRTPIVGEGEGLFELLLRDAQFRKFHVNVLEQTHSEVPAGEEQRTLFQTALHQGDPAQVPSEDRFAFLSDAETLKTLD